MQISLLESSFFGLVGVRKFDDFGFLRVEFTVIFRLFNSESLVIVTGLHLMSEKSQNRGGQEISLPPPCPPLSHVFKGIWGVKYPKMPKIGGGQEISSPPPVPPLSPPIGEGLLETPNLHRASGGGQTSG